MKSNLKGYRLSGENRINASFIHVFYQFIFPGVIFQARNWHLLLLEGCQWVLEPDLSPLLYKPKPVKRN